MRLSTEGVESNTDKTKESLGVQSPPPRPATSTNTPPDPYRKATQWKTREEHKSEEYRQGDKERQTEVEQLSRHVISTCTLTSSDCHLTLTD